MRYLILALLTLATACASDPMQLTRELVPQLDTVQLRIAEGETFELRIGQIAATSDGSLFLTLGGVESDSRCPVDVTCVWAGNAAVTIGTGTAGEPWSWRQLNSALDPSQITVGAHTLVLVNVAPERRKGTAVRPSEYRIVLRITRS